MARIWVTSDDEQITVEVVSVETGRDETVYGIFDNREPEINVNDERSRWNLNDTIEVAEQYVDREARKS